MSFNSKVNLIEFKSWSFSYFFLKSSHFINYNISEKKMEGSSKEKPQLKIGHYVLGKIWEREHSAKSKVRIIID